jgi:5-formyltetrahydrofolate cyclo-ligase
MTGIGFSEILLIAVLILLFFGSKELPRFFREAGVLLAKLRHYSDSLRRELDVLSRPDHPASTAINDSSERKQELRKKHLALRAAMPEAERREKSEAIAGHLRALPEFAAARAIMLYVDIGAEVQTRGLITVLLAEGRRVILPYVKLPAYVLGIGAIDNPDADLQTGEVGCLEPMPSKRDNFFKSDLGVIICPGVAFDKNGGRIGRGKYYFDRFLSEIKGRIPIIGLAYANQVLDGRIPFEYHDVAMDQIITENGPVIARPAANAGTGS